MKKQSDANVQLYVLCKTFIQDNSITCPESIYQTDRVIQNAYKFIEQVCENVGYVQEDEDAEDYRAQREELLNA